MRPPASFRLATRAPAPPALAPALALALALALGAFAPDARAAPKPTGYSLTWAPRGQRGRCIGLHQLADDVERLLQGRPFVAAPRADMRVKGQVGPRPSGGWIATFTVFNGRGEAVKTHEVSTASADCHELDEPIALNIALLIDPSLRAQHPTPEWVEPSVPAETDPWENLPPPESDPWSGLPPAEPDPWQRLPQRRPPPPPLILRAEASKEPPERHSVELSALVAYGMGEGVLPSDELVAQGGFGAGFGARVGHDFPSGIWLGASFMHHSGSSFLGRGPVFGGGSVPGDGGGAGGARGSALTGAFRADVISVELGYTAKLGPLELRPHLGLGPVNYSIKAASSGRTSATPRVPTALGAWPGVSLNLPLDPFFFGAELRWAFIADADPTFPLSLVVASGLRL